MLHDPNELLAATILETMEFNHEPNFVGSLDELRGLVSQRWDMDFTSEECSAALIDLERLGGANQSETSNLVAVRFRDAKATVKTGNAGFNPKKRFPAIYEYVQFGAPWLMQAWEQYSGEQTSEQNEEAIPAGESEDLAKAFSQVGELERRLVPASDRFVGIGDNQTAKETILAEVEKAEEAIRSSNELETEEKNDCLASLETGSSLLKRVKNVSVGAVRYLILDRIRRAFERTIEDVLRLVLIGSFIAIATTMLGLL